MMESRFNTVAVVQLDLTGGTTRLGGGASQKTSATPLVSASKRPLRVIVRNISFAAEAYLSFNAASLQTNEPGADTYTLPAGGVDTIVMAPEQTLHAISLSSGCRVSVAISEALPFDKA